MLSDISQQQFSKQGPRTPVAPKNTTKILFAFFHWQIIIADNGADALAWIKGNNPTSTSSCILQQSSPLKPQQQKPLNEEVNIIFINLHP